MVDPAYAKKQLDIMTREWYMKPDGALPAYEWNFSDVNPPVHAWATFRVFKIERKMHGKEDLHFLERVFQKLLINFTWYVFHLSPWSFERDESRTDLSLIRCAGGSTARMRAATTSSKEDSSVSTTFRPSTVRRSSPLEERCARRMEPDGWDSTALAC